MDAMLTGLLRRSRLSVDHARIRAIDGQENARTRGSKHDFLRNYPAIHHASRKYVHKPCESTAFMVGRTGREFSWGAFASTRASQESVNVTRYRRHAEIMGRRALVDFLRGLGTGISKGPLRRGFVRSVRIMLLNHPPSGRSFRTSLPGHPKYAPGGASLGRTRYRGL